MGFLKRNKPTGLVAAVGVRQYGQTLSSLRFSKPELTDELLHKARDRLYVA
jgi:hypothetical protein